MADRAGVGQVVLVHFRAELQDRIDRLCAARPGAMAGRPGLVIEVGAPERDAVVLSDPVEGAELDGRAPTESLVNIRIV